MPYSFLSHPRLSGVRKRAVRRSGHITSSKAQSLLSATISAVFFGQVWVRGLGFQPWTLTRPALGSNRILWRDRVGSKPTRKFIRESRANARCRAQSVLLTLPISASESMAHSILSFSEFQCFVIWQCCNISSTKGPKLGRRRTQAARWQWVYFPYSNRARCSY